ncbi:MAG: ChaN family lipoprotein [Bacteroidetes bacterium]|nr:ChaN family lipoprotein [Bacteroidota bacterium]
MKIKSIIGGLAIIALLTGAKSDRPAYRVFNAKGHVSNYADILKEAREADVVFFGEIHTNPICHWLELQLAKDLSQVKGKKLIIGAEMFERDNQLLLNEYISGMIRKKDFEAEAKLWANYKTDYAPLVDFAAKNKIKFVATNIPRRYSAIVNLKGFQGLDSINAVERGMMAPLPLKYNPELPCYKKIGEMMAGSPMHMGDNLPKAQAIKDATMAQSIFKNLEEGALFYHVNGSYHSENHEGVVWYLKEYNKRTANDLKIVTITAVEQNDLDKLEKDNLGTADFIIVIPEDMTKTQESSAPPISMPPAAIAAPGPVKMAAPDTIKKDTVKQDTTSTEGGEEEDDD